MPVGGMELLIILAIILLFFGAKRVPQLGRSLGQSVKEFRVGARAESDDHTDLRGRREGEELPDKGEDVRSIQER